MSCKLTIKCRYPRLALEIEVAGHRDAAARLFEHDVRKLHTAGRQSACGLRQQDRVAAQFPGDGHDVQASRAAAGYDDALAWVDTFGYGDLVVDMRNFPRLREVTDAAVLFDATHAVQRPGMGRGGTSGGDRTVVPALLRAAAAAGADGFFLETHPDPATAPSDGSTMWPLDRLESVIEETLAVWAVARDRVYDA